MRFGIKIPYVVAPRDREMKNQDGSPAATQDDASLTQFLVTRAMDAKFPPQRDASGQVVKLGEIKEKGDRKACGEWQNALQAAINTNADHVEISQASLEWGYEILKAWDVPPAWAGWYASLVESVTQALLAVSSKD